MKNVRVIARLDIKGPNLVKGIHLEGLRVLGKPEHFAQYYYENGADELFYMDIVASLYGRNSLLDIIERTSKEVFIPIIVGGGLRTIEDINAVLRAGADKVSLNTAAIKNPDFIRQAANRFGSSTIIVSIEAIKEKEGQYFVYTDNGREYTGKEVFQWAREVCELGAGEIMITSVDREGTGTGYDLELTKKVAESVPIPVIACGGAGRLEHIENVVIEGKADALTVASMIHYDFIKHHTIEADYSAEGNVEFLKKKMIFSKIETVSLETIKSHLMNSGINCRFKHHGEINKPLNIC